MTEETRQVCEDIVKLKDGKFIYQIGKATPSKFSLDCEPSMEKLFFFLLFRYSSTEREQ